jgi:hypothetical protein
MSLCSKYPFENTGSAQPFFLPFLAMLNTSQLQHLAVYIQTWGYVVALCYSQKVVGSIPDSVTAIFH